MKRSQKLAVSVVALTAITSLATLASGTEWQLAEQDEGISVYTRTIDGSPFLEVKGKVTINAPVERVSNLMGNGNGCAEWRANCKSSRVLEQVSERERYVYLVIDLPWPVSDRDAVVHSKTEVNTASRTATVQLNPASSYHPPQNYVRAESQGKFIIRAVGEKTVDFSYVMHTDLGGDLSPKAVNSKLAESVLDELNRLRELAENQENQENPF